MGLMTSVWPFGTGSLKVCTTIIIVQKGQTETERQRYRPTDRVRCRDRKTQRPRQSYRATELARRGYRKTGIDR